MDKNFLAHCEGMDININFRDDGGISIGGDFAGYETTEEQQEYFAQLVGPLVTDFIHEYMAAVLKVVGRYPEEDAEPAVECYSVEQ